MKKIFAYLLTALFVLTPLTGTAQSFFVTTNSQPGLMLTTDGHGVGIGITTPLVNGIYVTDGYGRRHHHRHHRPRPRPRHYAPGRAHRKAMKKARKAYRKEFRKQMHESRRHHRHHHDDD